MSKTLESIGYSIYFENSLKELGRFIEKKNYSKIFFLVDRHTATHCLPLVQQNLPDLTHFDIIEIEPGEENKNIDFCIGIWKMLLDFGADRKSLLINLGGGVVTDMGSFAASTFKRGIDFVQIPTTLLSQVDASVGGKTGIDMDQVKNCIGTFTQPKAVFIEPEFLKTLDQRQLISGFAEMIKHGLIADADYFSALQQINPMEVSVELIHRSVEIKNEVVIADPHEHNIRKTLNFGHTIGHAIESHFLETDSPLLHGEALAMGMLCEAYLSHQIHELDEKALEEICISLKKIFPLRAISSAIYPELLAYMQNDKKNQNGKIGFALLKKIGACSHNDYISEEKIEESLNFYQKTIG
ncbi:MAG: 3-dehydroquinate synthase [Sphingobacteriaceae bacterium]